MRKLYRSRSDSKLTGVAGGLAEYLGVDSSLVRLAFILLLAWEGFGFLLYVVLAIVIPRVPEGDEISKPEVPFVENRQARMATGGGLILLGGLFMLENLDLPWLEWLEFGTIWPAFLILFGTVFLVRGFRGA